MFLGQLSTDSIELTWVGPARAYVWAHEEAARAPARYYGGIVVNAPIWDAAARSYVVNDTKM